MKRYLPHNSTGFTIMELIVSIAIVSMMLFLINRIFFDTTEAVSRGIATSKIIANTRTLGEQLEKDFDKTDFAKPGAFSDPAPISHPLSAGNEAGFMMIANYQFTNMPYLDGRDKDGIVQAGRPVRSDQLCFIRKVDEYSPMTPKTNGSFVSSSNAQYCRVWYGHVIQLDPDGNLAPALGSGPDQYATNWILGRQVLFLDDKVTTSDYYADYDQTNWTVHGRGTNFTHSQSDILNISLIQSSTPGSGAATSAFGIIDALEDARANANVGDYYKALFTDKFFIYPGQFPAVRSTPDINSLTSGDIAQMHPYMLNNVSDFIVEFAGDYDGTTGIDTNSTTGNIEWYGQGNLPPMTNWNTGSYPIYQANPSAYVNHIFIFRHDDQTSWPKLLRIKYHMHDPKGDLMGTGEDGKTPGPGKWYEVIVKVPS